MKNETIILKRPVKNSKFFEANGDDIIFPANTPLQTLKMHGHLFAGHPTYKNLWARINPKNIKHINVCRIRKDILKKGLYVPIGMSYYASGKGQYKYRWTGRGASVFQIWYIGKWNTAQSIDFEF